MPQEIVGGVRHQRPVLQRAGPGLKAQRLGASEHIRTRKLDDAARASGKLSAIGITCLFAWRRRRRIGRAVRADAQHFKSETIAKGIATSFLNIHYHGLVRIGARGILRGDLNARKNSQIVEPPLSFDHITFAQWAFRLDGMVLWFNVGLAFLCEGTVWLEISERGVSEIGDVGRHLG